MLRVLVADDHAVVRRGVRALLYEAFPAVLTGEAVDGVEAVEQALRQEWDIMLLDITMPRGNGLQVLATLRQRKPQLPIIMLSMFDDPRFVSRCLEAGALGYLTKERVSEELAIAIQTVLAGSTFVSTAVAA